MFCKWPESVGDRIFLFPGPSRPGYGWHRTESRGRDGQVLVLSVYLLLTETCEDTTRETTDSTVRVLEPGLTFSTVPKEPTPPLPFPPLIRLRPYRSRDERNLSSVGRSGQVHSKIVFTQLIFLLSSYCKWRHGLFEPVNRRRLLKSHHTVPFTKTRSSESILRPARWHETTGNRRTERFPEMERFGPTEQVLGYTLTVDGELCWPCSFSRLKVLVCGPCTLRVV